ncbi:Rrf2 family transcriptional regulator [Viridibacillus arvi]|nr:Rrf2 family transcriptional regulator [Viridibacillus sp. JNUCC-6]
MDVPSNETIGIKDLAEFQGLSETYLSKVFSKLAKADIVSSVPGVNGGYKLAKSPENISFWDVIKAVEGVKPIFQCKNILQKTVLNSANDNKECADCPSSHTPCIINITMLEAEQQMREFLRSKTLAWLNEELDEILSEKTRTDTREYLKKKKTVEESTVFVLKKTIWIEKNFQ